MSLTDGARPHDLWAMLRTMQQTIDQHGEVLEKLTGFMSENRPTLQEIISAVCEFYDINPVDLMSHSHRIVHAHPRLVVYYLGRKLTRLTFGNMAIRMGERDHSTIYTGFMRIAARLRKDEILRDDIDVLRSWIAEKVALRKGPS